MALTEEIKSNESLAGNKIKKKEIGSLETIIMNTGNRKTNDPERFVRNLSQILDLKSLNKHVGPQN